MDAPARGQGRARDRRGARHRRSDGALLAAEGAKVACLDRPADDAPLSQIAREIGGTPILADVSDPEAPAKIAGELKERLGGVDVVVHNAGITRDKTLAKMKPELWDQTIDVNLAAVARITEVLAQKGGALRDGGRVICLSSVAGIAGNMGQTNYAASKAGIIGFVRALAPKLAGRGITVNAIAPGLHRDAPDGGDPGGDPRGRAAAVGARAGRPARGHRRAGDVPREPGRAGRDRADHSRLRRRAHRRLTETATGRSGDQEWRKQERSDGSIGRAAW